MIAPQSVTAVSTTGGGRLARLARRPSPASNLATAIATLAVLIVAAATSFSGELLPPDPGIDGGKGGHWGLKNDTHWVDARWNNTELGQFQCYTLPIPGGFVEKGISIRVGDANEAAVCFDTDRLSMRAAWTGKFIRFDGARYGLINWPKIDGELLFSLSAVPGWGQADTKPRYRGLHLNGKRVTLAYDIDDCEILESPWVEQNDGVIAITRTFQIGASTRSQTVTLAELLDGKNSLTQVDGINIALLQKGEEVLAVALTGDQNAVLQSDALAASIAAHKTPVHFKALIWHGKKAEVSRFVALVKRSPPPEDPAALCKPGASRWGAPLATKGVVGTDDKKPYVLDTLSVPYDNRFKALMFLSGVDFFANGDAAVCSLHGDVWRVRGIDEKLENITWQRIATGLFQPLGLKIVADKVYVLGRDQITILHDLNEDGETDFYENFNNACNTSTNGHDYSACLQTDNAGNFYHVDNFGLHRISKDGTQYETLAKGFRNPISLSVGPGDVITVSPQEGEWTPASQICEIKPNGYYGYGGPLKTPERPLGYDPPLCYIPRLIDNSTGDQVWVASEKWGPPALNGQLLNLSFGRCAMQLVLREKIGDQAQGGVVPLPMRFIAGAVRGRFRPQDGQLYVAGTMGWASSATHDGSFQRVRYTGAKVCLPCALNVHANGIRIAFTDALKKEDAEDSENFSIEQWNYHYGKWYGSADFSVSRPDVAGHDPLAVKSVRLAADGKSVFLEVPNLEPVNQMRIKYILKGAAGESVRGEIDNTINKLGTMFTP